MAEIHPVPPATPDPLRYWLDVSPELAAAWEDLMIEGSGRYTVAVAKRKAAELALTDG